METATAPPRFSAAKYARAVTDRSRLIDLAGIRAMLADVYGPEAVHAWRRRSTKEGGYGPVGAPAPDDHEPRGENRPRPLWFPGTIARWAFQTGRLDLFTHLAQQPKYPGKG